MEKYPAFRRKCPTDFHNPVREQLIGGNLWVVRRDGTTEKGLGWRESRYKFVVIEDTIAHDVVSERMQHGRKH